MADAVTTKVISSTIKEYVVQITNTSDGTGESAVVKIDKSTLSIYGAEPSSIAIKKIEGNVDGMKVDLFWDRGTDVKIATLTQGYNKRKWCEYPSRDTGSGGTGDVILTTTGHASGDSYDITLYCELIP